MEREQVQARIDRIYAFRAEVAALAEEGLALPSANDIAAHHDALLRRFAGDYDIDISQGQKQLSLGMRIASFLGALALSSAVYFLFLRFRGGMDAAIQTAILVTLPIIATLGVEFAARRERSLYFASIAALVAFASFVLDLSMLSGLFNIAPTQNAFLAWGVFGVLLAYAYGLRLILVAGLASLLGYLAATIGTWSGAYWLSFGERPENFLLAGFFLAGIGLPGHRLRPGFASVYRIFGLLTVFIAILILANWGSVSYLPFSNGSIENGYQALGFLLSSLAIWLGIRRRWPGLVNLGSTFFVLYLYTKLFDWWWDWLPKYLFFLLLGLIAIGLLLVLRRLHTMGGRGRA